MINGYIIIYCNWNGVAVSSYLVPEEKPWNNTKNICIENKFSVFSTIFHVFDLTDKTNNTFYNVKSDKAQNEDGTVTDVFKDALQHSPVISTVLSMEDTENLQWMKSNFP